MMGPMNVPDPAANQITDHSATDFFGRDDAKFWFGTDQGTLALPNTQNQPLTRERESLLANGAELTGKPEPLYFARR